MTLINLILSLQIMYQQALSDEEILVNETTGIYYPDPLPIPDNDPELHEAMSCLYDVCGPSDMHYSSASCVRMAVKLYSATFASVQSAGSVWITMMSWNPLRKLASSAPLVGRNTRARMCHIVYVVTVQCNPHITDHNYIAV